MAEQGLEVTLWAKSPLFYNPTNMDIDYKGRIWVAEDATTGEEGPSPTVTGSSWSRTRTATALPRVRRLVQEKKFISPSGLR